MISSELRCPSNHLWGKITPEGLLEIKCRYCSKGGTVVFHYFDVLTAKLVKTSEFQDPKRFVTERRTPIKRRN